MMDKFRKTMKSFLNKDTSWAYQEKMAEALVVIFLASKISVEFAEEFFPEWKASRTDPGSKLTEWDIHGRNLLGYDSDACFWNRALSFWKPLRDDPCLNTSFQFRQPNPTATATGYVGVFASLSATAILYTSFFCALWANRHWRLPFFRGREPFWSRKRSEKKEKAPLLDNTKTVSNVSPNLLEGGSSKQNTGNTACTLIKAWKFALTGLKVVGYVAGVVVLIVTALLAFYSWLALLVWPVILTGLVARATIAYYGDEAIFPCYAAFTCVMTVYCTGRVLGLWMEETYLGSIIRIKGVRALESKKEVTERCDTLGPGYRFSQGSLILAQSFWGCIMLQGAVTAFVSRLFPEMAQILKFLLESGKYLRKNTETLDRTDARLSYWVASEELFGNTTNATDFNLPELSPSTATAGSVWIVWSIGLAVGNTVPVCLEWLFLGIAAVSVVIGLICGVFFMIYAIIWSIYGCCTNRAPKPEIKEHRTNNGCEYPATLEQCVSILRGAAALYSQMFTWTILPCCAAQFFLPEHYQWPGILFIVTCATTWFYYVTVNRLWTAWQCYITHPDYFDDKENQSAEFRPVVTVESSPSA